MPLTTRSLPHLAPRTAVTVALTFDDGPSEWTEPILDMLAARDAHATFFVVGRAVEQHQPLLERAVAEGHEIGNHTVTHPRLTDLSDDEVRAELEPGGGSLWRAPYFDADDRVRRVAAQLGLRHVGASIRPADWRLSAETIVAEVTDSLRDGAVVCLHDGIPPDGGTGESSRAATVEAVRLILQSPARFVTVTELATA